MSGTLLTEPAQRSPRSRALRALAAFAIGLLLLASVLEIGACTWIDRQGLRVTAESWRELATGSAEPAFRAHPYLQYVRNPAQSAQANSLGFFGPEWSLERTSGTLRIACLGASTTEGDALSTYAGSYPFLLQRELEARFAAPVEVMNLGISGWTSAEIAACWHLFASDYRPDLVIVHESVNDAAPRSYPGFRADYSHYRKSWELPRPVLVDRLLLGASDAWLMLRFKSQAPGLTHATVRSSSGASTFVEGRFPAGTAAPYRRNIEGVVGAAQRGGAAVLLATMPWDPRLESNDDPGSRFQRVAMREHNAILRELAAAHGALLCDFERLGSADPAALAGQFSDIVHLSPAGNAVKARWIADQLAREWTPLRERDPPAATDPSGSGR